MFETVLIANRGEIACRIIRTLRRLNVRSVAVYSDADRFARHVREADAAGRIGPSPASESYLSVEAILEACHQTGAQAVHPGYGFLSESAELARRLEHEGIAFVGPRTDHLEAFGLKHRAREIAREADVPLLPGSDLLESVQEALGIAEKLSYPVMLKSVGAVGAASGFNSATTLTNWPRNSNLCRNWRKQISAMAASIWSGLLQGPATSRCRSSVMVQGASRFLVTGTAVCKGVIRKLLRKHRRRVCQTASDQRCMPQQGEWGKQ